MNTLQAYISKGINEAELPLPDDAEDKMNEYFDKIQHELKDFNKAAAKDKQWVEAVFTHVGNGKVYNSYFLHPGDEREAFEEEIDKFKKRPGKWKEDKSNEKYTYEIDDVTYEMWFDLGYILWIRMSYPIAGLGDINFTPNLTDKSKDITGKPIKVGDTVVFSTRTSSGNDPIPTGVVTKMTSKQITVYDVQHRIIVNVPGYKCCVIEER